MPLDDIPSVELIKRYKAANDQEAATELVRRYAARLIRLARARMSVPMKRRLDPEDIVQSVCRSFFVRVREGKLEVRPEGNLWALLTTITMRKYFGKQQHYNTRKRGLDLQIEPVADGSVILEPENMSREPNPEDVAAIHEERDLALAELEPHHREMVLLALDDYTPQEISVKIGYTDRQVRNVVKDFSERLRHRLR